MATDLRDLIAIIQHRATADPRSWRLIYDEGCSRPQLKRLIAALFARYSFQAHFAAWSAARTRGDSDEVYWLNDNALRRIPYLYADSKPVPGLSMPDSAIAKMVLAHSISHDVLLLSQNPRQDDQGIRAILAGLRDVELGPVRILGWFWDGRGDLDEFYRAVGERFDPSRYALGYTEVCA